MLVFLIAEACSVFNIFSAWFQWFFQLNNNSLSQRSAEALIYPPPGFSGSFN